MRYTIGTVVSDWAQYDAMQKSFISAGFSQRDCQYLPLNNVGESNFDLFSGGNTILAQAAGDYVILVHQDVRCDLATKADLDFCISDLEDMDGWVGAKWAVAGNAGADSEGLWISRITDRYGDNQSTAPRYPWSVEILDGNFLLIKRSAFVGFSADLTGFHYYGWDICLNADIKGYRSYVIDFHLTHLGKGDVNESFYTCKEHFASEWKDKLRPRTLGAFSHDKVEL